MVFLNESMVEEATLGWLEGLGYSVLRGSDIGPEGHMSERVSYNQVVLTARLEQALRDLNPDILHETLEEVLNKLIHSETPSLIEENRRLHSFLIDGVPVEIVREDGTVGGELVQVIDFENAETNDWLVVNQYTTIEDQKTRRPDVVVFINGLPLAVIELKNPKDESATIEDAFNQLQTYKAEIPSLFRTNALLAISDGLNACVGSSTANYERFMPWRTVDGSAVAPKGAPGLETAIHGVFEKQRFLALIKSFIVFKDSSGGLVKIVAGYHQFHAVRHAVERTIYATSAAGDGRIGVIWHTQGSGKSLLMGFYAGQIIGHPAMQNPTIVVITDRNDLDDQLFHTFSACRELLRQTPQQAKSREDLRVLLNRPSGGVLFTTIQKFEPDSNESTFPKLTDRQNVVVIADEAHRSQYGFQAKFAKDTGEVSYGFAKYLRDALPNASFIGFTGTPIEDKDINTPAIFGDYIDIYDIRQSVEDNATVPIFYESRLARIKLDEHKKLTLDDEIADLTEDEVEESENEKLKSKWASVEAVVGTSNRLALVARDLVEHFEARLVGMAGKAMIVCMSRRICVALYDQIVKLRPEWHSQNDEEGKIKIVMTGAASDPKEWQQHIGSKTRRELLAKRIKDPDDELNLVLVRDMWLTGFDAPSLHTMYVDKPMRGHGLMQAIARVNRVFRDKPGGLIVDYIGIAQFLKSALSQYSKADQEHTGIAESEAVATLQEKYEVVRAMFHGFDYSKGVAGAPYEVLQTLAGAIEWILNMQQTAAERESTKAGKTRARRRYKDAVLALTTAFKLAAASDFAAEIREEVGFFQAVLAALVKKTTRSNPTHAERDFAVQQIVSRAVVSTEIVDILRSTGMKSPDISIISPEFLAEVQSHDKKNLALEALRRLINEDIRSRSRVNVVQTRSFSERLEQAIARYHNNAITTAEVLQELIDLAKDINTARDRGEEEGLSDDEIAFYDALAENESAVELMGNEQLRVIAIELLNSLRSNATVDWQHRTTVRAQMQVGVKRILRKYGYPPDLEQAAVQTVLRQAEALAEIWASDLSAH